jgi:arsenite/tail-anchored protein-transporting ATPase
MMQLQDPKQTKVLIVTLAETTPVLEAASLQDDLRRAGIEPWAWVINNSLSASATTSPCSPAVPRRNGRRSTAVVEQHARRVALVPIQAEEPIGVERLAACSAGSASATH